MELPAGLQFVGQPWTVSFNASLEPDVVVTTMHNPPFVLIQRLANGTFLYDGYLVQLWELIAAELGLRYRIEPLLSGGFGSVGENGTWSGMVGELAYGRADVAVTAIYLRQDRASVIDYLDSVAVARSYSTFYVRAGKDEGLPPVTAELFGSLLQPLHGSVWWAVLVSLLVLALVLRIALFFGLSDRVQRTTNISSRSAGRKRESSGELTQGPVVDMGLGSCLLFSFTSFVGQGWPDLPLGTPARLVAASCWALRTIIYTSYTANLISHMVVHSVALPIRSLKEFAEQPGWRLAIQPGHAILNDWRRSRDPYGRELYRRSVTRQGFIEINFKGDSVFELVQPKVMTFVNFDKVVFALGPEVCHLVPIPGLTVKSKDLFMGISKRRPALRRAINDILLKMKETGMLAELKARWIKSKDEMCVMKSEYQQMSLGDMFVVLIILPVAMVACAGICLIEWGWFRFSQSGMYSKIIGKMSDSLLAVAFLKSRRTEIRGK
ncbi:Glutamate receptor 1 [Amphibalanus amphitrite]|uniref:Glutamate receptor 1 n=1 Tax=Amphibalanus amphitrite TaxID=1232801 RepID=A0A6A4W6P8_AMPAM|nr:Glutamate receptor 1 [Amphibalanus amphitrite]